MNYKTLEYIIQAFNTASKDATRVHLQGVLLKTDSTTTARIVACDGYMLSEVAIIDDQEFTAALHQVGDCFVPTGQLARLKLIAKETRRTHAVKCAAIPEQGQISINDIAIDTCKTQCIEYPNFEAIKPKDEIVLEIELNPEYLMSLFEALKVDKRSQGLKLAFGANFSHIRVSTSETNTGILMPRKLAGAINLIKDHYAEIKARQSEVA